MAYTERNGRRKKKSEVKWIFELPKDTEKLRSTLIEIAREKLRCVECDIRREEP